LTPFVATLNVIALQLFGHSLSYSEAIEFMLKSMNYGSLFSTSLIACCWFWRNMIPQKVRFSIARLSGATVAVAVLSTSYVVLSPLSFYLVLAIGNAAMTAVFALSGQRRVRNCTMCTAGLILFVFLCSEWSLALGEPLPLPFAVVICVSQVITIVIWLIDPPY
jgi:hypothetical protein